VAEGKRGPSPKNQSIVENSAHKKKGGPKLKKGKKGPLKKKKGLPKIYRFWGTKKGCRNWPKKKSGQAPMTSCKRGKGVFYEITKKRPKDPWEERGGKKGDLHQKVSLYQEDPLLDHQKPYQGTGQKVQTKNHQRGRGTTHRERRKRLRLEGEPGGVKERVISVWKNPENFEKKPGRRGGHKQTWGGRKNRASAGRRQGGSKNV